MHAAQLEPSDLSGVAVTIGPGLSLCLKVGVLKAGEVVRARERPDGWMQIAPAADGPAERFFRRDLVEGGKGAAACARKEADAPDAARPSRTGRRRKRRKGGAAAGKGAEAGASEEG